MGLMTPLDLELPYPNNLIMPEPYEGGWSGVTFHGCLLVMKCN